jgi:hypothetical protein
MLIVMCAVRRTYSTIHTLRKLSVARAFISPRGFDCVRFIFQANLHLSISSHAMLEAT